MMPETVDQIAWKMLEEERREMLASARLLHRRLGKLIETGDETMGHDLPTIVSMLTRMRDSVEAFRSARATHNAVMQALAEWTLAERRG
jgi:formate dehydrogenase assembly factor FdhD